MGKNNLFNVNRYNIYFIFAFSFQVGIFREKTNFRLIKKKVAM